MYAIATHERVLRQLISMHLPSDFQLRVGTPHPHVVSSSAVTETMNDMADEADEQEIKSEARLDDRGLDYSFLRISNEIFR